MRVFAEPASGARVRGVRTQVGYPDSGRERTVVHLSNVLRENCDFNVTRFWRVCRDTLHFDLGSRVQTRVVIRAQESASC